MVKKIYGKYKNNSTRKKSKRGKRLTKRVGRGKLPKLLLMSLLSSANAQSNKNRYTMVDTFGDIKHRSLLTGKDIEPLLTNINLDKKYRKYKDVKKNFDDFRNSAEFRGSKSNGQDNSRKKKSTLSRSR